ncbi:MAG TPA: AI-2E family transporter [Solirubrobacteraceae bacterium]|nr:AI-2E family transporter [Solirubrobacteraceae bacterium]
MRIRRTLHGRVHRESGGPGNGDTEFVEIDASELSGLFAAPTWLRDLGIMAWLLVGIAGMLVGAVWLLSLTNTIVIPVVTAAILASVLAPLVRWLKNRGIPRGAGAAIVLLLIVLAGGALALLVLGGISGEADHIQSQLKSATSKIEGWLKDLGVDSQSASDAKSDASSSISSGFHFLIKGLGTGLHELASLAVFLSFTVLSLFFLLKDGPMIRRWLERHLGVPNALAHTISGRTIGSMRGYFAGVTAVAAFNGVVIGLGALVLGVPLAGSIAVVNFVAAYIPYLGAWTAGAFTVLIALGDKGPSTAVTMGIIVLLANGALQQLIQPIAYGAALGIHPLAVLIVTIAGGALFGTIGLIVAAPLTSAAVKIAADVARARPEVAEGTEPAPAQAAPT